MQGRRDICYHFEVFHGVVINYPTYDKELYAFVQAIKRWKHYLMGKEIVIGIDFQSLQYLYSQSKLQQTKHYKWMVFLQQFHLLIKYNNGNKNKLVDMLSTPPASKITILGTLVHMEPFTHETYKEAHIEDDDFMEVYHQLQGQNCVDDGEITIEYHL